MDKKELTEVFKIIYDSLSEGKYSEKEIKQIKNDLSKHKTLAKYLITMFIPYVKNSQFSFCEQVTPYDLVRHIEDLRKDIHNPQSVDDEFINKVIELLSKLPTF